MEIRKAGKEDLARILEIQRECYLREAERAGDPNLAPMVQSLEELEAESSRCAILKGTEGEAVVGSVRASMEAGTCRIGRLVVLPEFRGAGRGAALLRAIEAEFPGAERYELFTGSTSADNIRLYERAGYRQFKAEPANGKYCLVFLEKPGPASRRQLSLGVDPAGIGDYAAYKDLWNRLPRIEARMVEKSEECRHELGETLVFDGPYDRPAGICHALSHVFELYLWRLSLGFPSWNGGDRSVYRLHCPDAKGTVWELRALPRKEQE
jgi:GNAT superfamily N-acetyltransferase